MLTSYRRECTLRTRLWLWLFTLVFAGFVLHATVCACEVVHPGEGSTRPCITQCHKAVERTSATQQATPPDILHPTLLTLVPPPRVFHLIFSGFTRFAPEYGDPLLARGPPLLSALSTTSGAR